MARRFRVLVRLIGVCAVFMVAAPLTGTARADGGWLDEAPLQQWNTAGMALPAAPPLGPADAIDPRCLGTARVPESAEDGIVTAAGWRLSGAARAGEGITVVGGTISYDGMCRPFGYQLFVFADGRFAGTVSPVLMNSRMDGAAVLPTITGPDRLSVDFVRYTDQDPLCCPSRTTLVTYQIARGKCGSVLLLIDAATRVTGNGAAANS